LLEPDKDSLLPIKNNSIDRAIGRT